MKHYSQTEVIYTAKHLRADNYDTDFYQFCQNLRPSRELFIQDVDALIRDRNDNFRLLEIKRNNYNLKGYQRRNILILDALLKAGIAATGGRIELTLPAGQKEVHNVKFHGYNVLKLSGNSFDNSGFNFDDKEVSKQGLIDILNFC